MDFCIAIVCQSHSFSVESETTNFITRIEVESIEVQRLHSALRTQRCFTLEQRIPLQGINLWHSTLDYSGQLNSL